MAILTIPSVTLGTPAQIYLSKSELFALAPVAADSYFSAPAKVKWAIAFFEGPGKQREILRFDLSLENPFASLLLSAHARGTFELKRLILEDHDGGILSLERAELPASLDVLVSQAGGGGQAQGGGNTPQAPSLISSGLVLKLESDALVQNNFGGVDWTDTVSGRSFSSVLASFGGGQFGSPIVSIQPGAFDTRQGLRLQGGYKMSEVTMNSSFLFGGLQASTVLIVGGSNNGDLIDISNGGMTGVGIVASDYNRVQNMPRLGREAFGEFYSNQNGPQVAQTGSVSFPSGDKKVLALSMTQDSSSAKFFANGVEATAGVGANMGPIMLASNSQISIGGYFPGAMQDVTVGAVVVYDRVLTAAEVLSVSDYLKSRYGLI